MRFTLCWEWTKGGKLSRQGTSVIEFWKANGNLSLKLCTNTGIASINSETRQQARVYTADIRLHLAVGGRNKLGNPSQSSWQESLAKIPARTQDHLDLDTICQGNQRKGPLYQFTPCQGRQQVPEEAWVPGGLMLLEGTGRRIHHDRALLHSIHEGLQTRLRQSTQTNWLLMQCGFSLFSSP